MTGVRSRLAAALLGLVGAAFVGCSASTVPSPEAEPVPTPSDDAGRGSGGSSDASSGTPDGGIDEAAEEMHTRADLTAETMLLRYWQQISAPGHNGYWTYAHDWNVILDAVERRGPQAFAGTIRMFYDAQDARGWIVDFYDDEEWMTLTLIHAYQLTKDTTYLLKAQEIFNDIRAGWDDTCCGAAKGGIWWNKQHVSKVTASNAGAVIAGALLYEITNDAGYLASARKFYDFWVANMVDPTTGHVFDNIDAKTGVINKAWSFTYNEGLMIGAAVALARVEKDDSLVAFAQKMGDYMLAEETDPTPLGTVLSDGPCGSKGGDDGEQFKGIGARYLAELYRADPTKTRFKDVLVRSSNALWTYARDPSTNLVSCYWPGPHQPDFTSVNALSSAAMTLAATAQLMGPAVQRPVLEYRAEESTLHKILLEANHKGYEGWGYVAGWAGEGQWLDFPVSVPSAGTYDVELRYASTEAASREIYVNGSTAIKNLELPSSSSYGNYVTVTVPLALKGGKNSISMIYRAANGSHGYVNLDRIKLTPKG